MKLMFLRPERTLHTHWRCTSIWTGYHTHFFWRSQQFLGRCLMKPCGVARAPGGRIRNLINGTLTYVFAALQAWTRGWTRLTKSVTYVLFVFSRNHPQKRKRMVFSVWRLNRSFESVCLLCWLESCWSRSLLLSCSSPSLLNAHSYKNVGVYCRCVASRPPCGRWGVCSVHTHIHRKHMHTHFLMLKHSHTNTHRHTHRFSRFQFKSVALTLYTHTHMWAHTAPWGRCPASTLRPRSSRPPRLWGVFGFVFGGSGCQPGVRQLGKPHHAD